MRVRIAIEVYNDEELIFTRFCNVEELGETFNELYEHPTWEIGNTYYTDEFGNRLQSIK